MGRKRMRQSCQVGDEWRLLVGPLRAAVLKGSIGFGPRQCVLKQVLVVKFRGSPSDGRVSYQQVMSGPEKLTFYDRWRNWLRLEATKVDISRYTLIVQGFENMITTLHQSNAQDEHDPTFVEMLKQRSIYEDLLEKAVSGFGSLPYCDTPGCPVHENPTSSSPVKSQPTKRKEEDGFSSLPQEKYPQA
ncbi:hypothetical protein TNCV_1962301 [Trichonephila clavipes]|nr:hypothetical protein TNCV_1962301 [Trichonephila clavipes]